jgi:hypothetical protein
MAMFILSIFIIVGMKKGTYNYWSLLCQQPAEYGQLEL